MDIFIPYGSHDDVVVSRPKSSRDWHPHLPSYVSEPTITKPNISDIITQYNAEDLNSLMKIN